MSEMTPNEPQKDYETLDDEWRRVFETEVQQKLREWGIDPEDRGETT
jgi:hypothetical protein